MALFGKKEKDVKELLCPYTALKSPCIKDGCPKWTKLQMQNPQDGTSIDQWACGDTWVPILLVELSQKMVRMDATVENHRNAAIQQNDALLKTIVQAENINLSINKKLSETMELIRVEAIRASSYQLGQNGLREPPQMGS
jgi:hypothetical protein